VSTCSKCGEENPERARFCLGCGAALAAVCPACGEENPTHARFCLACGQTLRTDVQTTAPRELRKTVTVVFCDVTGSTTIGERLDPESLRRVMSRYFDEMRGALERHGGTVEKFIGDAVMAVFGIPVVHEDDALRAVRAAAEMRRARDKLNEELERTWGVRIQARIGVNTGEVVAGSAADGEGFATGDTVNVAARLEQAAAPGEILIGEETYQLARDAVRVERVEPLTLKGKAEPVPAFRLIDVDLWAAGYTRRLDSPLVGRVDELDRLRAAFDTLSGATLVSVIGAAGLGKSRLTSELLDSLDGVRVLRGRCLSYGDGVSFWPVMEIVHAAAAIDESDSRETARAKLQALLPGEPLAAERVAAAVGLGEGAGSAEETFWGVRKLLEALAAEAPLVVLIDDCHWASSAMLDLVEYITGWAGAAPIVLLCLGRPELLESRPAWPTTLALGPLPDPECAQLLDNLLGGVTVDADVQRRVLATAEGNPLFLEQLAALVRDDGTGIAIPPSIQALVAARLDRLGQDERSAIERGAIEGKVFHRSAVQHLTPDGARSQVPSHLLTLVRKDFIGPDEALFSGDDAFRFRNTVVRDAAYDAMPKQARADLHERFVEWLESTVGERASEYDEIVAHHLEQAYRYLAELGPVDDHGRSLAERAANLYARAATQTHSRGDVAGTRYLLEHANGLAPERLDLLPALSFALRESGELTSALEVAADAFERARASGDKRIEAYALIEQTQTRLQADPEDAAEEALRVAERVIPVFDELEDHVGLARAWKLIATREWVRAQADATSVALEHAIEHSRLGGDRPEEVDALAWLAVTLHYGPKPVDEALDRIDEILERSGRARTVEATARAASAGLQAMVGRFDEARSNLTEARAILRDLGLVLQDHSWGQVAGFIELRSGDPEAAERQLRPSIDALEAVGERGYRSTSLARLAEALYRLGRLDEAERAAATAAEIAGSDDTTAQVEAKRIQAKVFARRERFAEAEALARDALELVGDSDFLDFHADTEHDAGEVLELAGRGVDAAETYRRALELYERKGDVVEAEVVRERLSRVPA
jgi:class 3 adenylate cyclase/tetratricopeptide (TPR) repeat protein